MRWKNPDLCMIWAWALKERKDVKNIQEGFFFFSSLSGFVCLCFLFSFLLFFNLPITFCSVSFCPFYLKIINKLFILSYLILDL